MDRLNRDVAEDEPSRETREMLAVAANHKTDGRGSVVKQVASKDRRGERLAGVNLNVRIGAVKCSSCIHCGTLSLVFYWLTKSHTRLAANPQPFARRSGRLRL
jgi:ribosomal protein L32